MTMPEPAQHAPKPEGPPRKRGEPDAPAKEPRQHSDPEAAEPLDEASLDRVIRDCPL